MRRQDFAWVSWLSDQLLKAYTGMGQWFIGHSGTVQDPEWGPNTSGFSDCASFRVWTTTVWKDTCIKCKRWVAWPCSFTALPFGCVHNTPLVFKSTRLTDLSRFLDRQSKMVLSFSFICTFNHQLDLLPGHKGINYFPSSDKWFIKVFMRKRVKWLDYWIIRGLSKPWVFINPSLLWRVFRILSLVIMSLKMSSKAIPFNISLRIRENPKELFNRLIFLLEFIDVSAFIPFEFRFREHAIRPWILWFETTGIF